MMVIEESLKDLGYRFDHRILDAADFGVPQHRERIYIVGFKAKKRAEAGRVSLEWPGDRRKNKPKLKPIGPFIESGQSGLSISRHLQTVYLFKKNDGRPQIVDGSSDFPVKTLCASYHKIQRLTGTFVRDGETGIRLLSANECKAIMGFPKTFKFPVSRTQMYRQMGNSVAVPVIKVLARWIADEIEK